MWKFFLGTIIVLIILIAIAKVIKGRKEFITYPIAGAAKGVAGLFTGLFGLLTYTVNRDGGDKIMNVASSLMTNDCPSTHPYSVEMKECAKSGCPVGTMKVEDNKCVCTDYKEWDPSSHTCINGLKYSNSPTGTY